MAGAPASVLDSICMGRATVNRSRLARCASSCGGSTSPAPSNGTSTSPGRSGDIRR